MPPCLDIYVLTPDRTHECLAGFLSEFAHPTANADRSGEELMLVPLGSVDEASRTADDYDWHPISTLTEALQVGLDRPHRAFSLYLKARDESIYQVSLGFRADGLLFLGLSIDDPDESDEALARARALLRSVAATYQGVEGFISCEEPPPLIGPTLPAGPNRVVFFWKSSTGAA